ncbi:MAG: hypothetical protein ACRDRY_09945 [Pseudonocardiaceae bacterium]
MPIDPLKESMNMHTRRSGAVALAGALVLGTLLTSGAGIAQAGESQQGGSSSDTVEGAPKVIDLGDIGRFVAGTGANLF